MPPDTDVVTINEIRSIMAKALDALEAEGIKHINLKNDGYWTILSDEAFNLGVRPELAVGSLSDDIADLRKEMQALENDDGVFLWHVFHHLGGIVLAMAERSRLNPDQD